MRPYFPQLPDPWYQPLAPTTNIPDNRHDNHTRTPHITHTTVCFQIILPTGIIKILLILGAELGDGYAEIMVGFLLLPP